QQRLPQDQQQHGVQAVQAGQAPQQFGGVGILLALAHEGDLGVVVDDQFEELVGQARFDGGAIAQQLGVAGAIAPAVQEGPLQEMDQDASGLIDQGAARRGRGVLGGEVVVGIGAKVRAAHGSTPY